MMSREFTSVVASLTLVVSLAVPLRAGEEGEATRGLPPTADSNRKSEIENRKSAPDLLTGAIDPFEEGRERQKFLKAAGKDAEMDKPEFEADGKKPDGFVRGFEKWDVISRFDKNKNTLLDWLEVKAYRQKVKEILVKQFDADKNSRLILGERDKANELLESGNLRLVFDSAVAQAVTQAPAAAPNQGSTKELPMGLAENQRIVKKHTEGKPFLTQAEFAAMKAELDAAREKRVKAEAAAKWDVDGDGEVREGEKEKAEWIKFEQDKSEFLKKHDADGDGRIGPDELAKYRYNRGEKRFDLDADGKLDDAERANWRLSDRGTYWAKFDEFDTNPDGLLDPEEKKPFSDWLMERLEKQRDARTITPEP